MRVLAGLFMLLFSGCAMLAPGANERATLSGIVTEAVATARAPAPQQHHALRAAQEAYGKDGSVANKLRLATLLAVLPAPLRDDSAAYALLKPLAEAQGKSPYESFGALLAGQVAERLRLARERERAYTERERAAHAAQQREEELRRQFEYQQHVAEQREAKLQEQLDALKSIERGIVEREEKLRRNRR